MSEAKYKPTGTKPPITEPTSFLWTIGPRPFWELWPHKKYRKKKLTLEDFTRSLLEHWAKTHGYPIDLATMTFSKEDKESDSDKLTKSGHPVHYEDDTRVNKLKRSVLRLTKRYHKQERMRRKSPRDHGQSNGITAQKNGCTNGNINEHTNGHIANGLTNQSAVDHVNKDSSNYKVSNIIDIIV